MYVNSFDLCVVDIEGRKVEFSKYHWDQFINKKVNFLMPLILK